MNRPSLTAVGSTASAPRGAAALLAPLLAAGAILAGCAAAEPRTGLERPPVRSAVMVTMPDGEARGAEITRESHTTRAAIAAPRRQVWNALPDAYTDVGLPLPALDNGQSLAAVQNHRATFRLGQDRLSRFFDCGSGPAGLHADRRSLRLNVYVALAAEAGDGTVPVEVRADATAHSTEGASAPPVECSSSGALEQKLVLALQLRALQQTR